MRPPPLKKITSRSPVMTVHGGQIIGRRSKQEDSYFCEADDATAIGLLADGLGGCPCGEVASRLAIQAAVDRIKSDGAAPETFEPKNALKAAFKQAHEAVESEAFKTPACEGMGTTLAAFIADIRARRLWVSSCGDSRILKLSRTGLKEAISESTPRSWDESYPLHHVIGIRVLAVGAVVHDLRLNVGDKILLASDGIESLSVERVEEVLKNSNTPQQAVEKLLCAIEAFDAPEQDNATIVALFVTSGER